MTDPETWTLVLCDGQWLIGQLDPKAEEEEEEFGFALHNVWGVWHQVGVQPGPQGAGSFSIMQTPALVIPLLNLGGPVDKMWVLPTLAFTPAESDQQIWRQSVENARRATLEQRTGLTLASALPNGASS